MKLKERLQEWKTFAQSDCVFVLFNEDVNEVLELYEKQEEQTKQSEEEILKDFEKSGYHICKEEWKIIIDYPNYEISNLGKVRNKNKEILKPYINKKGYLTVKLWRNNKKKGFMIHRLVAEAFIPNFCNLPHINHRDGNKANNKVCNLEWVTPLENNVHAIKSGLKPPLSEEQRRISSERMKKLKPRLNKRYREVVGINLITNEIKKYYRIVDTKNDGFKPTGVYATCKGKTRWHNGWFWHYKEYIVEEQVLNQIKKEYNEYIKLKEKGNVCFANIKRGGFND